MMIAGAESMHGSDDHSQATLSPDSIRSSCWSWPRVATARHWGSLLERYRNYVGLLVRLQVGRRLRSKVDVDDLLQEIWLEIHRKIRSVPGRSEREFLTLGPPR